MNKLSHKSALPPIRPKLLAAFGSALLVLVVAWVGIAAINRQNETQQRVYHAHEVRFRLRNIYDAVLEAQVGRSSYPVARRDEVADGPAHYARAGPE